MTWEVFNPKDGIPVVITRFKWAAKSLAWIMRLDYARQGEGWTDEVVW